MKLRNSKNKEIVKLATKYQPWDYGFNIDIEKAMLKKMYLFFSSDKPRSVGSERVAKEINLALKLLDIILEKDDACVFNLQKGYKDAKYYLVKYINSRNYNRFVKFEPKNPLLLNELRKEKAWFLYNKLRLYRMQSWWD